MTVYSGEPKRAARCTHVAAPITMGIFDEGVTND